MRVVVPVAGFTLLTALVFACSSSDDDSKFGDGQSPPSSTTTGGTSGDPSPGFGDGGSSTTGDGGTGNPGNGTPEICDSIDNDGNGIIDDVDRGGDGICDCLRIATLGAAGTAGVGNVFAAWLDARSDLGATNLGDQELTPALLAGYQVIVAQNLKNRPNPITQAEVDALQAWIKAGGGFMTLIGYSDSSERTNVNKLLEPYGMNYEPTPILAKQGGSTIAITNWVAHPVTADVTRLGVDNGYAVAGNGSILATEQGFNLLQVKEVDQGHVLMWGDEWITFDSEWSGHPDYQVERFWLNAIKWLTPTKQCQVALPPPVK